MSRLFTGIRCSLYRYAEPDGFVIGSVLFQPGEEFYDYISKWVDHCRKSHRECSRSRSTWLPTRLVDVGELNSDSVRIVATKDESQLKTCPYLTLSHCWGKKEFLVMDQGTKHNFETGVPIATLAPNFQDAIHATRRLGYRYIWIDSLCIIQGSAEDWAREAPLMNLVYKNSALTLAATASSDAYGGFFRDRDPDFVTPFRMSIRIGTDEKSETRMCFALSDRMWAAGVRNAPLHQRAWVVQERLLSPRTLHFGESQLFWECREQEACEVLASAIPRNFLEASVAWDVMNFKSWSAAIKRFHDLPDVQESAAQEDGSLQYENQYEVWENVLRDFSRCALTVPADKFVAISGVVKEFQRLLEDEYLAGLWRGYFVQGLLWYTLGTDERNSAFRPAVYRAPSWSWAAVEGPITMAHIVPLQKSYVDLLDVQVKSRGADATGELESAHALLRGYLVPISRPRHLRVSAARYCGIFYPDDEDEIKDSASDKYFCVPLGEDQLNHPKAGYHYLWGLVVIPETAIYLQADAHPAPAYRRVGVFRVEAGESLQDLAQRYPDTWDESQKYAWFDETQSQTEFLLF
ncbi:HET-domain-containing protein [Thozetella sp. PMI_491]|nr:HET-domain-containing protein [Thozetella sp. PMI_491]